MQLTIESLKSIGAFTGAPVEKEIKWKQDKEEFEATVFIKPLSYKSTVSDLQAVNDKKDPIATRIAACVCDETGAAIFTADDITGDADPERGALDGNLAMSLLAAIAEVNYMGKTQS